MTEQTTIALGREMVRLGSILVLNPHQSPLNDPQKSYIGYIIMAALNQINLSSSLPAVIRTLQLDNARGGGDDGPRTLTVEIVFFP